MILGAILERFCVRFGFVCNLMKTRKIARRVGESTKIEDVRDRKCCNFPKKTHRKYAQKLKRKMIPKWSQFGCQMEPKWRQKGIQKSMFFLMVFQRPLETLIFLRRVRDGSASVAASVTLSPADPPGRRHLSKNIVQKQAKTA